MQTAALLRTSALHRSTPTRLTPTSILSTRLGPSRAFAVSSPLTSYCRRNVVPRTIPSSLNLTGFRRNFSASALKSRPSPPYRSYALMVARSYRTSAPVSHSPGFSGRLFSTAVGSRSSPGRSARLELVIFSAAILSPFFYTATLSDGDAVAEDGYDVTEPSMFLDQNPAIALKGRSVLELLRSLAVFQACQIDALVDNAPALIDIANRLHLSVPVDWFIRHTFFGQFCGGESAQDVVPAMQQLEESGIGSILDLSVEADVGTDENPISEKERVGQTLDLVRECVDTASIQPGSFAAVKVTALGATYSLRVVSGALSYVRDLFRFYQDRDGLINFDDFCEILPNMPGGQLLLPQQFSDVYHGVDSDSDGRISWNQFQALVGLHVAPELYIGEVSPSKLTKSGLFSVSDKYLPSTSPEDVQEFLETLDRLAGLCQYAVEKDVKLMFDAEQTYFQAAIDHIAIEMMKRYNRVPTDYPEEAKAYVYNTYQMYLKDSLSRLMADHQLAQDSETAFVFGAKLVRGAYMHSERKRAAILEVRDPIHDTIESTHESYDGAVAYLLSNATVDNPVSFCIASHNRDTIAKAVAFLEERRLSPRVADVSFAQLYGMHDHTSCTIAERGFKVYKYLPYGPVSDVMPYLLRRAQENKSILAASSSPLSDKALIWNELLRRFSPRSATASQEAK